MRTTGSGEDVSLAFATLSRSAGDDGDLDLDFDALSGEFAAIVSQSAALR
jgi:hypothetical protein